MVQGPRSEVAGPAERRVQGPKLLMWSAVPGPIMAKVAKKARGPKTKMEKPSKVQGKYVAKHVRGGRPCGKKSTGHVITC